MLAGLALLVAAILIPAQRELHDLRNELRKTEASEARIFARLQAYDCFLGDFKSGDPALLRRLAAAQLNLVPAGEESLLLTPGMNQTVAQWIDESVPTIQPVPETYPDTLLARFALGPNRLWMIASAVFLLFIGFLLGPDDGRAAVLERPLEGKDDPETPSEAPPTETVVAVDDAVAARLAAAILPAAAEGVQEDNPSEPAEQGLVDAPDRGAFDPVDAASVIDVEVVEDEPEPQPASQTDGQIDSQLESQIDLATDDDLGDEIELADEIEDPVADLAEASATPTAVAGELFAVTTDADKPEGIDVRTIVDDDDALEPLTSEFGVACDASMEEELIALALAQPYVPADATVSEVEVKPDELAVLPGAATDLRVDLAEAFADEVKPAETEFAAPPESGAD